MYGYIELMTENSCIKLNCLLDDKTLKPDPQWVSMSFVTGPEKDATELEYYDVPEWIFGNVLDYVTKAHPDHELHEEMSKLLEATNCEISEVEELLNQGIKLGFWNGATRN